MNVLITGASGYLGSRLTDALLREGHALLCPVLAGAPLLYLEPMADKVEILPTDSAQFAQAITAFSVDSVVHTACRYERGDVTLEELADANLIFPLRILNALLAGEKPVFWLNTDTALEPDLNAYALSKAQFAQWGRYQSEHQAFSFCNVLLEHFIGPGDSGSKLVPFLRDKMLRNEPIELTDGEQRRDFVYVDDVVGAFLHLLHTRPEGYTQVPVGTGQAPRVREVIEFLKEQMGSSSPLLFGALPRRINEPEICRADTDILNRLGYACTVSWQEGIRRIVSEGA